MAVNKTESCSSLGPKGISDTLDSPELPLQHLGLWTWLLCLLISSSKLNVWWRLIPLFSSFKSTHPSPVILKDRIPQGANLSNNSRETSTTSKQTQKQQQRPRAQSSLSLNFHTCEHWTWQGHLWIGENATCLSSINSAACLSPRFSSIVCLFFVALKCSNCISQMLVPWRCALVGRCLQEERTRKGRGRATGRKMKKEKRQTEKRERERERSPTHSPMWSWIYAEMLHLPYMYAL